MNAILIPRNIKRHAQRLLSLALLAFLFLSIFSIGLEKGQRSDTTAPYQGAKYALQGINPYSNAVTRETQQIYWGDDPITDEHRFAYPATSIFIFGWLTLFPLKLAYILWAILQVLLLLYALHQFGASFLLATLLLFGFKETLAVPLMGQSVLWSAAFVALALHALEQQHERRAGLYFALSCLHPVLTVPLALITLLYHAKALRTFLIVTLLWLLASLLLFGMWIDDWIITLIAYRSYVDYLNWLPALLPASVSFSSAVLTLSLFQRDFLLRHTLSLCALLMLLPVTGLYQMALLVPALSRLPKPFTVLLCIGTWFFTLQPLETRRYQLLILPVLFIALALIQHLPHWTPTRFPIRRNAPS